MKKLIPFFSIAIVFAACNPTPKSLTESATQTSVQPVQTAQPDTTGLSQYQAWKAQNELASVQQYNQVQPSAPVVKTVKYIPRPAVKKPAPVVVQPKPAAEESGTSSNAGSGTDVATTGSASTESTGEAKAAQKKGISKAAKGAVIGGVVGAAGGAVINKNNRVLGAVIGGVVGAAGGYGIGRGMDKKDGRIEYSRIEL